MNTDRKKPANWNKLNENIPSVCLFFLPTLNLFKLFWNENVKLLKIVTNQTFNGWRNVLVELQPTRANHLSNTCGIKFLLVVTNNWLDMGHFISEKKTEIKIK